MAESHVSTIEIQEHALWDNQKRQHKFSAFEMEITARCNNDCRHCYINVPAGDASAKAQELSPSEILRIAGEAASLGAVWCLVTGGEPLLRPDFPEIYLGLKRLGLLVSVFTNATPVTDEHVALFRRYPPRDIEVTVYGATKETYERVTRRPGSYDAFMRGLDRLLAGGVKVRLKTVAIRSNMHEMAEIERFCRERTKDYHRFDPVMHLRLDGDPARNADIRAERLTPDEVVMLEQADEERFGVLIKKSDRIILPDRPRLSCDECCAQQELDGDVALAEDTPLFSCGVGEGSFNVSYDGTFPACSSLSTPDTNYDLRRGSLREALETVMPRVRAMRTTNKALLRACKSCAYVNLCRNCPAHAYLETGDMQAISPYFCQVAHARAEMLSSADPGFVTCAPSR